MPIIPKPVDLRARFIEGLRGAQPAAGDVPSMGQLLRSVLARGADVALPDPTQDPFLGMVPGLGIVRRGTSLLPKFIREIKKRGYKTKEIKPFDIGFITTKGHRIPITDEGHAEFLDRILDDPDIFTIKNLGRDVIRKAERGTYSAFSGKNILRQPKILKEIERDIRNDRLPGSTSVYVDSLAYQPDMETWEPIAEHYTTVGDVIKKGIKKALLEK